MTHEFLESIHNPRVKLWSRLADKKARYEARVYLLEGVHLVQDALRANVELEALVYPYAHGIPAELATWADDARWIAVSDAVFRKCCDVKTPQAAFAVARMQERAVDVWFNELLEQRKLLRNELILVADGVQDPGNVGTMIRSAAAIGADGMVLGTGCADAFSPKTVRASMGALFHVPVLQVDSLPHLLERARASGAQLLAANASAQASMYDIDMRRPLWLIVGNEGAGVSPEIAALATKAAHIPMGAPTESLNVAMATTVLLYEAYRQRTT